MDIKLKTNSEDKILEMNNIKLLEDNSAYKMNLDIYSRAFSVSKEFYIEPMQMDKFLKEIEEMNKTLKGLALMKPLYEEEYIEFSCDKIGHINVKGEIFEHSEISQHLKFEFVTDQTCLPDFINDLRKCIQLNPPDKK
jgi:hypothetical protein